MVMKNNGTPSDGLGGDQNTTPGMKFKRVTKSFPTAGGSRRGSAKIAIGKTGSSRANLEGKQAFLRWVRNLGFDHTRFSVTFGGNEDAGTMAIYYAKEDDPGAMLVTQTKNALYFHCGECFNINPLLRPAGTVDCSFTASIDADGDPCLIVNISGGTPSRTVKRPEKQPQPQQEHKDEKKA